MKELDTDFVLEMITKSTDKATVTDLVDNLITYFKCDTSAVAIQSIFKAVNLGLSEEVINSLMARMETSAIDEANKSLQALLDAVEAENSSLVD